MGRRITCVIHSLEAGGAQRVMVWLADELSRAGHDVTVLVLKRSDSETFAPCSRVRVVYSAGGDLRPSRFRLKPISRARRWLRLRQLILSQRPELVISFIDIVNVNVLGALMNTEVPIIVSERSDPAVTPLGPGWRMLRRALYPLAAALVVQTDGVADWAGKRLRVRRVVRIPNPAVYTGRAAYPANRVGGIHRAVAVGRLCPQKGFDVLIEAWGRAADDLVGWELRIFGAGPDREALERQINEEGLGGRVLLAGIAPWPSWSDGADAFVLSSRFEGFPNALVEAMAAGIAVVATDCPSGPGEIVVDGVNGLLVPVDDPEALAVALVRVTRDPELRTRVGTSARAVRERYEPTSIAEEWLSLIDACARKGPPK